MVVALEVYRDIAIDKDLMNGLIKEYSRAVTEVRPRPQDEVMKFFEGLSRTIFGMLEEEFRRPPWGPLGYLFGGASLSWSEVLGQPGLDRRLIGLHGRAFVPMMSGYACAVPAIMATRTIENKRDRLATILIAPFMTCAARLPVYTLVIAACSQREKTAEFSFDRTKVHVERAPIRELAIWPRAAGSAGWCQAI